MEPGVTATPAERRKGIALMLAAGLCWSTAGILVRNVALDDAWEIVLWRSLFMSIFVAAVLAIQHRGRALEKIAATGIPGVWSGVALGATFFFFILSVTRTTVANTLVLMSTGPFFVALAGHLFLGERVPARTWAAIAVALAGVVLMFADSLGTGQLAGNLLALGVPVAFAFNVVVLRRHQASVDLVPAVLIAGVVAIAVAAPLAWPLTPSARDLVVLGVMGSVQVGAGCVLMTMASRYLTAGELGLLALLETALGPLWVWLGIGERPAPLALAGGAIVLGALLANAAAGRRSRTAAGATVA
jgi:drug/metabolite transporter (DMT)-like permease